MNEMGRLLCATVALFVLGCSPELDYSGPTADWLYWGGDEGATHYSPLTQITPENVHDLEVAWVHRSGDVYDGSGETAGTEYQVTPLVIDGLLYYCTPFARVFALHPETGEEVWSFDPDLQNLSPEGPYPLNCRGISYWEARRPKEGRACERRIFHGTRDSELLAIDAKTGELCADFGEGGRVALREGVGSAQPWEYYPTSAPLVLDDIVVVGAFVADNYRVDVPSGVVRAFDARSGDLVWAWDPVPEDWKSRQPGEGRVYHAGTPNVWSTLTTDSERKIVYVPTGNPSPDYYGGQRDGVDHYGSSVVALDGRTGKVRWHFQTTHHDVWDYDVAAPPTLFQMDGVGNGVPALVQSTKMGFLFLLDRVTGKPLYPIEERPVPTDGAVPGEVLSPTQPFPTHPPPLHPTALAPEDAFGFTFFDRRACRKLVAKYRWEGIYTPPTLEGSIQIPHTSGGMNRGGVAIDPERGLLIVNQTELANSIKLIPREDFDESVVGEYPIERYPMRGTPYALERNTLLSPFGAPCSPPPWGSLTAVDLRSGEVRWRVPMGTTADQAPWPLWMKLGSPSFGGGIATASGVFFIGASTDKYFRAFDVETGEEIWRDRVPYQVTSVPMTFRLRKDGRQFVVAAASGNPILDMGDALIAWALPE
jgi:quinoprotein glucose dehydrogenase